MAARRVMSPMARLSASRVNVSSAAAMRRRIPGDVRHERPQKLHGILRPHRPVAFAEHVGDEDDVALPLQRLTGFDGRLDDALASWAP